MSVGVMATYPPVSYTHLQATLGGPFGMHAQHVHEERVDVSGPVSYTHLDVYKRQVHRFEAVNGVSVPYRIVARRPGDVASCYADPSKAFEELGWKAVKTLDDMVRDSWMWQLKGAKN